MADKQPFTLPLYDDVEAFERAFLKAKGQRLLLDPAAEAAAAAIIERVRNEGDQALLELTQQFDGAALTTPEYAAAQRRRAIEALPPEAKRQLEHAAAEIREYHERQPLSHFEMTKPDGSKFVLEARPMRRVGLYVPGGLAAYPSSVLMAGLPARIAGVEDIIMCTPPDESGELPPAVVYAADLVGVSRIFTVGGAQAIAAMAFGTETVPQVDKVVGPGNAYVAAAKRQLFGYIDIDSVAGPSEIAIIADAAADPEWLALDLLAQAEHGVDTTSVLISPDRDLLTATQAALAEACTRLDRQAILRPALADGAAAVAVDRLETAIGLVNKLAPEHLYIWTDDPEALIADIDHAGAIFCGPFSPVALGDYIAGPSHVLPTGGSARYFSQLTCHDFVRLRSIYTGSAAAYRRLAPTAAALADLEGLSAHAASLRIRSAAAEREAGR